jgi:hypothetical protein
MWGTRPQFQAGGEGTCSGDWRGKAELWADMGEGALRAEIEGKHGRGTDAGEGSNDKDGNRNDFGHR